ncbi:MAG: hypothetical protein JWR80_7877 [Bradyrhizobium sp.]|nr:hypothetical protein [Bradyrhizobium sp.]
MTSRSPTESTVTPPSPPTHAGRPEKQTAPLRHIMDKTVGLLVSDEINQGLRQPASNQPRLYEP